MEDQRPASASQPLGSEAPGDTLAFIVRVWPETARPGERPQVWRGSIERVGSGERLYFVRLESIAAFIREHLGLGRTARRSLWARLIDWLR